MNRLFGTIAFIFLMVLATAGLAAYVMQEALGENITFVEFFQRYIIGMMNTAG